MTSLVSTAPYSVTELQKFLFLINEMNGMCHVLGRHSNLTNDFRPSEHDLTRLGMYVV